MTEKHYEWKEHYFRTYEKHHDNDLAELNQLLSEGWIIDKINCDAANEYDVECDLRIYLKRQIKNT